MRAASVIASRNALTIVALLAAALLFTRFGLDDKLSRDESIYAYAGQQLAHGVAPYVSIFDPKTPGAQLLSGLGFWLARLLGADGLDTVRIVFGITAGLAVAAVALLAAALFDSALAGLAAAVAMVSFEGFAVDALGGPDAKTPGVLLAVTAMLLLVRHRWFWAAFAGSLAFLFWQPLIVFPLVAVLGAAVTAPGGRRRASARALAGAALPVAATVAGFWAAGALPDLVEATVRFPLTGIERGHESFGDRLKLIDGTVASYYGRGLFYAGLVAALALVAARARRDGRSDPYIWVVGISLAAMLAFPLTDFQGYPDLFPLLPYAALGVGGVVAFAVARVPPRRQREAGAVVLLLAVAALAVSWARFAGARDDELALQRADAATIASLLDHRGPLYAIGDPAPLVLTGRRNPSRYIYLGSGVDRWKTDHTPGGFEGWTRQIQAVDPAVVVMRTWHGDESDDMKRWLERSYRTFFLDRWEVFVRD